MGLVVGLKELAVCSKRLAELACGLGGDPKALDTDHLVSEIAAVGALVASAVPVEIGSAGRA